MSSLTTQVLVVLAVPYLYFTEPVTYVKLIAEDNWGEFAAFAAFMIASYFFAAHFFLSQSKRQSLWYLLLSVGTFFVAMEEISWGQRLLGISTPEFLKQVNFQSEITLHNIAALEPESGTYLVASVGLAVYGLILPALTLVSRPTHRIVQRLNFPLPSFFLAPLFVASGFFLSFAPLAKGEEIGELFMGIALACFSVDSASRTLKFKANRLPILKLSAPFVAALFVWLVLAQFLVPALIESAYFGKSHALFNKIITGQANHTLAYYQGRWLRLTWSVAGLILCTGLVVVSMPYAPRWCGAEAPYASKCVGTPAVMLVALGLGLLLTMAAGSSKTFLENRLTAFVTTSLPGLGHNRQAETILGYLEIHSSLSRQELLVSRGRLAMSLGRVTEARVALEHALELQLRQNGLRPNNPETLQQVGTIQAYLGDIESARKYWNEAVTAYETSSLDTVSWAQKTQLMLVRAEAYEVIGEYDAAIGEYLEASAIAPNEYFGRKIQRGLKRVLSTCKSGERMPSRFSLEEVEAMRRKHERVKQWCTSASVGNKQVEQRAERL